MATPLLILTLPALASDVTVPDAEAVIHEWVLSPKTQVAGATMHLRLAAMIATAGSTVTFRVLLGGTSGALDGDEIVTLEADEEDVRFTSEEGTFAPVEEATFLKLAAIRSDSGLAASLKVGTVDLFA